MARKGWSKMLDCRDAKGNTLDCGTPAVVCGIELLKDKKEFIVCIYCLHKCSNF